MIQCDTTSESLHDLGIVLHINTSHYVKVLYLLLLRGDQISQLVLDLLHHWVAVELETGQLVVNLEQFCGWVGNVGGFPELESLQLFTEELTKVFISLDNFQGQRGVGENQHVWIYQIYIDYKGEPVLKLVQKSYLMQHF